MKKYLITLLMIAGIAGGVSYYQDSRQEISDLDACGIKGSKPCDITIKDLGASPPSYLPRKDLTPGQATTLDYDDITRRYDGLTYSQAYRDVSLAQKKRIYKAYGLSYPQPVGTYQADHLYPLCAGASNQDTNLWPQRRDITINGEDWGYRKKDRLDTFICAEIKAKRITPKEAFDCITENWMKCYEKLDPPVLLGGAEDEEDDNF